MSSAINFTAEINPDILLQNYLQLNIINIFTNEC